MLRIALAAALAAASPAAQTIFVDATAAGAADGSSWTDAFTGLQPALASALPGQEIWVAAGVYHPAPPGGNRAQTFALPDGVAVYGGFAGDELTLAERKGLFGATLLSGDLNDDDAPGFAGVSDNSYHVVTLGPASANAVLDGFTVQGGNADGPGINQQAGAGLRLAAGATLRNLIVRENRAAQYGGGAQVLGALPLHIESCVFEGNQALAEGGALHQLAGELRIFSSTFRGNATGLQLSGLGGAVHAGSCSGSIRGSLFAGNTARRGGGLHAFESDGVPLTVDACTFYGNQAVSPVEGGGIYSTQLGLELRGTVLWGNAGPAGTDYAAQLSGFGFVAENCCIQGMSPQVASALGTGNFSANPLFADPAGPDGTAGTLDDDLKLTQGSPAIDAGNNGAAAGLDADLGGLPRLVDDPESPDIGAGQGALADVGAHEYHSLSGSATELSLLSGGLVRLELDAGAAHAGEVYIVLGSASGTVPGLSYLGFKLTLNPDPYFFQTLNEPSVLPLFQSIGNLDADGTAETIFLLPPGLDPILSGLLLHHAAAVLDPTSLAPEFTSTAFPLQILP